jgi:hypothetical protein
VNARFNAAEAATEAAREELRVAKEALEQAPAGADLPSLREAVRMAEWKKLLAKRELSDAAMIKLKGDDNKRSMMDGSQYRSKDIEDVVHLPKDMFLLEDPLLEDPLLEIPAPLPRIARVPRF